jgi:hemolysin III
MSAFRIKPYVLPPAQDAAVGAVHWNYDRAEVLADAIVHALGIGLGLVATTTLVLLVGGNTSGIKFAAVSVYAAGLLAMLLLSATYNLWPVSPRKWLLRRLDHSAIYLLIAATYTPFISQATDSKFATQFLVGVWAVACAGIALKLRFPGRFDKLAVAIYLGMGWSGFIAYDALATSLSPPVLALIAVGGALYTFGVIFHSWERLRFQNAIWHGFVVLGAACHYAAVLDLAIA